MSLELPPKWARISRERVLRVAATLALVALGLIVWALVDPSPWAIIAAMSLGQALGTLSLAAYLLVMLVAAADRPPPR